MSYRLASIVRDHGRARPDRPAVSGDGKTITYAGLDERSSRVASALLAEGLGRGSRVIYLGKNAPEFLDLLFGAVKIGAVTVPVNWRLTDAEVSMIAADAMARAGHGVMVVDAEFAGRSVPVMGRTIVTGPEFETWLGEHPAEHPEYAGSDDDVVIQLYTSGTTGRPKGVQLSNANFTVAASTSERWLLDGESVNMVPMPLFHIGGAGWALAGLQAGAHDVLVRDADPAALVSLIEDMKVTNTFLVPAVLQFMCAVPGAADRDYSSLRAIMYGASPITSSALSRALETFRAPLVQLYGMTETTGAIVQLDPEDHHGRLMRAAGRPFESVALRIVEPVTGEDLPAGQVGEVWTRSSQNTSGYWNQPAESALLHAGGGWLRTGDAGYLDEDGYLFLTDRIKDMIVTGGENVYPIEVEEVLAGHPGIADVAVIGVPDEKWGEAIKAVVVPEAGRTLTEDEVLGYARERLAGFKRPRSVDFAGALPRNPTGKILKKELRAPYWEGRLRNIS